MKVKDLFKPIQIIHAALCLGVLMIIFIIRFVMHNNEKPTNENLQYIGIVAGIVAILLSRIMFINKIQTARKLNTLSEKINMYKVAMLLQMSILEAAAILNIILYFLFKNEINFAFSLAMAFLMIIRRPTIDSINANLIQPINIQEAINEHTEV
jgi:hypothetical protein